MNSIPDQTEIARLQISYSGRDFMPNWVSGMNKTCGRSYRILFNEMRGAHTLVTQYDTGSDFTYSVKWLRLPGYSKKRKKHNKRKKLII